MRLLLLFLGTSFLFLGVQLQTDSEDSISCTSTCNDQVLTSNPVICEGVFKEACLEHGKIQVTDCLGNFSSAIVEVDGQNFLSQQCNSFLQDVWESVDDNSGELKKEFITCTGVYEQTYTISNSTMEFYPHNKTCRGAFQYTSNIDAYPRLNIANVGTLISQFIYNNNNNNNNNNSNTNKNNDSVLDQYSPFDNCNYTCNNKPYDGTWCVGEYGWLCEGGEQNFSCSGLFGGVWKGDACFGPVKVLQTYDDFVVRISCSNAWGYLEEDGVQQLLCEGVYSSTVPLIF